MCVGVALSSMVIQPILLKFMEVKSIVSISVLIVSLMLLIQGVNELQTIDASLGFVIITSFILYLFLPLAGTGYTCQETRLLPHSKWVRDINTAPPVDTITAPLFV